MDIQGVFSVDEYNLHT